MKWFQVESNTPNDPKIRRLIRDFGNAGFGALVRIWCFVAEHGAEVGKGVDSQGRSYNVDDLAHAAGATKEKVEKLMAVCAEVGHIDPALWAQSKTVFFPAMAKRGDEYTRKRQANPDLLLDKRVYAGGPRRREVFEACNWTCQYCGKHSPDGSELEVDHRIPKAAGGKNERSNLTTSCRSCNRIKGDRPLPGLFVGGSGDTSGESGGGTKNSGHDTRSSHHSTGDHNTSTSPDSKGDGTDYPRKAALETWFTEVFWPAYPSGHRGGKPEALKALLKIAPSTALLDTILDGVRRWALTRKWQEGFVEHASTFLNQRRWEDIAPPWTPPASTTPPPPPQSGRTGATPGKYSHLTLRAQPEVH
ncbi:MAG: HNH endonuclease [Vicinamibacterales bacterium]